MSSTHLPDVSEEELAIMRKFGERYRRTHESIMTIGELLTEPTIGPPGPPGPASARRNRGDEISLWQHDAIMNLIDRGWLVTSSPVHWNRQSDCILVDEGLSIARRIARGGDGTDRFLRIHVVRRDDDVANGKERWRWVSKRGR